MENKAVRILEFYKKAIDIHLERPECKSCIKVEDYFINNKYLGMCGTCIMEFMRNVEKEIWEISKRERQEIRNHKQLSKVHHQVPY
jgi:hypothetical protein